MKKIIVVLILLTCFMVWKNHYQVKFAMGWERCGFMMLKGGYRAWWIRYSEGRRLVAKKHEGIHLEGCEYIWKTLWCFPRFEHCDVRPFLKKF